MTTDPRTTESNGAQEQYLSVSQVNRLFNAALEREFPAIRFVGEISQISTPQSGHIYLSIKDETGQLAAVMWKGMAAQLKFKLQPGMQVNCFGKPNVYQQSGKLQVILSRITPVGEGTLQQKFLALKEKLAKEGLFSEDRKRPIPFLPCAIGVVTSPTGAVINDIMVKLQERMPQIPVYLAPCRVQGEGSVEEIVAALQYLNNANLVDVIILARGGGSLEDLWSFNDERVVRAIFASKLPIVSGVGHEVDVTLADLVADRRAPTPTAAAELVVPKRSELLSRIDQFALRLKNVDRFIDPLNRRVEDLSGRLKNVDRLLAPLVQRVDDSVIRLGNSIERIFERSRLKLAACEGKLEALGPKRVLQRGYAIVMQGETAVTDASKLSPGDSVGLVFGKGSAEAEIVTVKEKR